MITSKLQGGLGNQLFQYAAGKAEAMEKGEELRLDISWYKGRIDRKFMLGKFNTSAKIANPFQIFFTKIFSKKKYITGDFQSEKYFKNIEDIIRKEFTLKKEIGGENGELLKKIKAAENSVGIHLRGGDYVRGSKSGFHGTASKEYYEKAIQEIKNGVADPLFFIFTDDIAWAQNHIQFPEPFILASSPDNPPEEELMLMSACRHNIIANSTFSWWSAWLNQNRKKIIIAPKKWFADEKIDTSDILPPSWKRI